jgi:hypothetical protein
VKHSERTEVDGNEPLVVCVNSSAHRRSVPANLTAQTRGRRCRAQSAAQVATYTFNCRDVSISLSVGRTRKLECKTRVCVCVRAVEIEVEVEMHAHYDTDNVFLTNLCAKLHLGSRLATWCQTLCCHGEEQCMAQASSASTAKGCSRCAVGFGKLGGGGVACARKPSGSRRSASRGAWCPRGKRCASAAGVASGRRSTSSSGRSASGQAGCPSDTCCAAATECRVSSGVAAHGAYPLGFGRLVSA